MYADISCSEPSATPLTGAGAPTVPGMQRTRGHARVSFRQRDGRTSLDRLYQEGSAKIRFPRVNYTAAAEAVLINTAGGLTGGDRLVIDLSMLPGARASLTTQACERIYRSIAPEAVVTTTINLAAGSRLDWLPQETILFDGGRLSRSFEADLAGDSELLAVEAIVLGRQAMGEKVVHGSFRDRWRISREGKLLFADNLRFDGDIAALAARPAVLADNRAFATVLLVSPECEALLERVRAVIGETSGASAWNGKILVRLVALNSLALRAILVPALAVLMNGRALPKVWQI